MTADRPTTHSVVVAGTAARTDRGGVDALDTVDAMVEVVRMAAADAEAPGLLDQADAILVPRGSWTHPNPGAEVAAAIGSPNATTVASELGVLQTTLVREAVAGVVDGRWRCAIVVGCEVRDRQRARRQAGLDDPPDPEGSTPDVVIAPEAIPISRREIDLRLVEAVQHYAMIEVAMGAADGLDIEAQVARIDAEWRAMADIAEANDHAWTRDGPAQLDADGWGRPLAWPYRSRHVTQWNVNQAAAVIISRPDVATACGSRPSRWLGIEAIIESDDIVPLTERADVAGCVGFDVIADELRSLTGTASRQWVELYSCFPVAVRAQVRSLGLDVAPSITGGMTFGGGPYNNFVLQSFAAVAERVRETQRGGLVTAVSGMLTKQGAITLVPAAVAPALVDVTERVAERNLRRPDRDPVTGSATVVSATVATARDGSERAVLILDQGDARTLVAVVDPHVFERIRAGTIIGAEVDVSVSPDAGEIDVSFA